MRQLVVSEWVTLDGVFDADTMSQWFEPYDSVERQVLITETVSAAGAFLLGRVTYEMFAGYWPNVTTNDKGDLEIGNKLNSASKYVVSSTLKTAEWNNSTIVTGNVTEEVMKLKQQPGRDILLFGSATLVQSLMKADLIDQYRLLVHPLLMGTGKRLFKDGMVTTKLRLAKTTMLSLGVMSLCYEAAKVSGGVPERAHAELLAM